MADFLTHLDLFSGIGGFALAAQECGFTTVGFCEIDPYAQQILIEKFGAVLENTKCHRRRPRRSECEGFIGRTTPFQSGPPIIHPDIFTLDGTEYLGVDLVTGGFPCQPFSCAGKRRGKEDDRHLWPEMLRVIAEARPRFVVGENVPGIIGMELDNCLSDLEAIGYACRPIVVPACAVDARHRRDRVWILAVANSEHSERRSEYKKHGESYGGNRFGRSGETLANTVSQRGCSRKTNGENAENAGESSFTLGDYEDIGLQRIRTSGHQIAEGHGETETSGRSSGNYSMWLPEPNVGRVANGVPARTHRLRALGNAIVPQVAVQILKSLTHGL